MHDGVNLVKTIPGVEKNETVVLTRMEIETQIIDEVKNYIYDLFEPTKHKTNHMRDTYSVPAEGLNNLPFHYFTNAAYSRWNIQANDERDEMGYVVPVTSRSIKKGEEILWPSHTRNVTSAADYKFFTREIRLGLPDALKRQAAYIVNNNDEELEESRQEIARLRAENAKLNAKVKRPWRPLQQDGEDVGKYGQAHFDDDDEWVDVFIKSFSPPCKRHKRGKYRFEFKYKDEGGKPRQARGRAIEETDWDDVSVGDPSVRVQGD